MYPLRIKPNAAVDIGYITYLALIITLLINTSSIQSNLYYSIIYLKDFLRYKCWVFITQVLTCKKY